MTTKTRLIASAMLALLFLSLPLVAAPDKFRSHPFTSASVDAAVDLRMTGMQYHQVIWSGAGTRTSCAGALEWSDDGSNWSTLIDIPDCTTNGASDVTSGVKNFVRLRITTLTGSGHVAYLAYVGSIGAVGATSTPSTFTGSLAAGSEIVGKVGIDQTTPGTTNGMYLTNLSDDYPVANYNTTHASNGTTDVTLKALVANNSIVVEGVSIINSSTTNDFVIHLCDGACSTSNWIALPAPGGTAANRIGAMVAAPLGFTTTVGTALNFACATDCSTSVTVSVTYRLIERQQ
jgi:hypothetical protein